MGWVRVDDSFYDHPKFGQIGALGMAAWIAGLAYCNRNLTDGFIPTRAAMRLIDTTGLGYYTSNMSGRDAEPADGIDELVGAGLWVEEPGGYRVHDYLDYQPSADEVRADRARARERMKRIRSGRSSADVQANTERSSVTPNPTPNSSAAAELAALPPPVADLIHRLGKAKVAARWDRMTPDQLDEVCELIERHGAARLVRSVEQSHIPDNPAQFASAWLAQWRALPDRPHVVAEKCQIHHQEIPCPGCAADSKAAS